MKKRRLLTILLALIMLATTACGTTRDVDTKLAPQYTLQPESIVYSYNSANDFFFTEEIKKTENVTFADISEEIIEITNSIERELYDYLVAEYNLNWNFIPTKIVALDFSTVSSGEYSTFAAIADPKYETVYMNILTIRNISDLTYRLSHELIHCMIYYNEGSMGFLHEDNHGNVIGHYTAEAYTDMIAADFLESRGEENPLDYFLTGSGYCYTIVALQILDHSIPGAKEMYLKNNMQDFHQALKTLGEKYMADGNTIDYGELFLFQADMNLKSSQNLLFAETTEKYQSILQIFLRTLLGNFEIVLGMSDGLDVSEEVVVFKYLEYYFDLEGRNEQVDKYLKYLKTCLD